MADYDERRVAVAVLDAVQTMTTAMQALLQTVVELGPLQRGAGWDGVAQEARALAITACGFADALDAAPPTKRA